MLKVYLHQVFVGFLSQEEAKLSFCYDEGYLQENNPPLSYHLPLSRQPYHHEKAGAFFTNLLPAGAFRRKICTSLKIDERDDFSLLAALGEECAGAVSVLGREVEQKEASAWRYRRLEKIEDEDLFGVGRSSSTLAGSRYKTALSFDGTDLYLPEKGAPSSHIIKMDPDGEGRLAVNELYCNRLAGAVGLPVPHARLFQGHYLVERYDRAVVEGQFCYLHQENVHQALGLWPAQRYQAEGGAGLKGCFELLSASLMPVLDKKDLLNWVLFNYLIGNTEGHGQNLSILHTRNGFRLAPFTGLLCRGIDSKGDAVNAMKLGGTNRLERIRRPQWVRFAHEEADISDKYVLKILNKMAAQLIKMAPTVAKQLRAESKDDIIREMEEYMVGHSRKVMNMLR
ncbi:MAG: HipA domain-containing protein [Magnetococcales bacterium]|nr:HipA domain-containing protein [Magnetococcales bacterium]